MRTKIIDLLARVLRLSVNAADHDARIPEDYADAARVVGF
jgi:hypothetical protein